MTTICPCFVTPSGALVAYSKTSTSVVAPAHFNFSLKRPRSQRARAPVLASFSGGGPNGGRGPNAATQVRVADAILRAGRFFKSTNGQILLWGSLVWLVVTGRAGFLFDSFLFLAIFISVVPVVGITVFRWWVSSRITSGSCPNCGADVTGLRGQKFQCMSCGEAITGDKKGDFAWAADPSSATIDIDAKTIDID
jgi:hypothetical protein